MTAPNSRLAKAISDRYTILREVGVGGTATVFLAQDRKHDRKVALKVLKPELTAGLGAERFPREIRTVAQFNHPHILSLYDSGEVQGFLYYVMPYVEGESLRQRLKRETQLPIGDVLRIMHEVADALAYSHARGVVHRDITPANVLLSGRHAVVTDFGVAKALDASGHDWTTTVGIAVGTPQYMAPEQAMGESSVDHRVDIYALGLVAYEMLAGYPTFVAATTQAMLAAQVMETPVDIQKVRPDTPPVLAETIMRCLAKNRADRWQSAEELVARLETIASSPTGGMTPTESTPHATKTTPTVTVRRNRRALRIGAVAAIVIAGAVGAYLVTSTRDGTIEKLGVMPIEDISGQDSVFVAAMLDALTSTLTRTNLAAVAPRSVMMRYRASTKTLQEIAKEQSLGAVVETTVFRAGDVMRINVQLSDPETSRVLWSETYEKDVKNVLAAQNEVVGLVASGVSGVLTGTKSPGGRR